MTTILSVRSVRFSCAALCLLLLPRPACADTLRLIGGETREGALLSSTPSHLILRGAGGEERYAVERVAGLTLSRSDRLILLAGDTLECKLLSSAPAGVLVVSAAGSRVVPHDSIQATFYNTGPSLTLRLMPSTGDLFRPTDAPEQVWEEGFESEARGAFERIDTLLARGELPRARDSLEATSAWLAAVEAPAVWREDLAEEYRRSIVLLEENSVLPDSVAERYCENIERFRESFDPFHAGHAAAAAFEEALQLRETGNCAIAYGHYLLARFFLGRHTRGEHARLLSNLAELRAAMKDRQYDRAESLVELFRGEPRTQTYMSFRDTLERAYAFIEHDLRKAQAAERFESGRVELAPSVDLLGGVALFPLISFEYSDLQFINPATGQPAGVALEGTAVDLPTVAVTGEAGVYLNARFLLGISCMLWASSGSGSFVYQGGGIYQIHVKLKGIAFGVVAKYFFDTRTGFRPYGALHAGYVRWVLSPDYHPEIPRSLPIVEIVDTGPRLVCEAGSDYVFSKNLPLTFNGFVAVEVFPDAGAQLLPSTLFAAGIRVGAWF